MTHHNNRRSLLFIVAMFLAITLSALTASAETVPTINQIGCRTNVPAVVMAVPIGTVTGIPLIKLTCVAIDTTTLKVDTVTGKLTAIIPLTQVVPVFIDAETPGGTLDGTNTAFTLASPPAPAASLVLYRNGVRLRAGTDFALSGVTLTFLPGAIPVAGDLLIADYRR